LSDRSDLNPEEVANLVQKYYMRQNFSWTKLTLYEKFKLVKVWHFVTLLGCLSSIFGSIFLIFSEFFYLAYADIFIGFGAFCCWCSITKYLANTQDFSVI
jgi:hypothetical protein